MNNDSIGGWDEFFQTHRKLMEKIEKQLKYGDEKQKQEAMFAYNVLKEQIQQTLEQVAEGYGVGVEEIRQSVESGGADGLGPEMQKQLEDFRGSLKKAHVLIRKENRKKNRDN